MDGWAGLGWDGSQDTVLCCTVLARILRLPGRFTALQLYRASALCSSWRRFMHLRNEEQKTV